MGDDSRLGATERVDIRRLDGEATRCFGLAIGLARVQQHRKIHAAHLALAYLTHRRASVSHLFERELGGLRPSEVQDSLNEILELHAAQGDAEAVDFPSVESIQSEHLSAEALAALREATAVAEDNGQGMVDVDALGIGIFRHSDAFILDAFADAGVGPGGPLLIAERLATSRSGVVPAVAPLEAFAEGRLDLRLFALKTRRTLEGLGAGRAIGGRLKDVDLLLALIEDERSLLTEALHVIGAPVPGIRRQLRKMARVTDGAAGDRVPPREADMTKLLIRVFENAASDACSRGRSSISEATLLGAHLDLVGLGPENIYERLRVDTRKLRRYVERALNSRDDEDDGTQELQPADDIEAYLAERVLGQQEAIERVVPALKRMRTGMGEPGRPLGVFLFLGPTGVGKTELARAMADIAFGLEPAARDAHFIRIDASKLQDEKDVVQLIGARQGLVGYKEGQLTNALRDKPNSVLLFDESDKAHRKVWQSILTLLDEGIVQDAEGIEYDATGCIVVFTSNEGYARAIERHRPWRAPIDEDDTPIGHEGRAELFGQVSFDEEAWKRVEESVLATVQDVFSPEFLGRLGRENIVVFKHFSTETYRAIVQQQVAALQAEMSERGLKLVVNPSVLDFLTSEAVSRSVEGARPVRRLITQYIRDKIIDARTADPAVRYLRFGTPEGSADVTLEA